MMHFYQSTQVLLNQTHHKNVVLLMPGWIVKKTQDGGACEGSIWVVGDWSTRKKNPPGDS